MADGPPKPKLSSRGERSHLTLSDTSIAYTDLPEPHRSADEASKEDKRGGSFFRRRLPLGWGQKHQENDQDAARGPFGLRLLHASPQPLIDVIFVHGLRGGSSKTWRKGDDPRLFWPQYWLPLEPDLSNANIHSFGYDSDWGSFTSSVLNVHDFGQTLYGEMRSSPHLRQNPDSPIILIGHSMGGLVIKKAYISAHQDQTQHHLADRIRCIFFLATPHKGSEYASTLNRILKMSGVTGITSSREYISEISKGSTSAQLINEDFGRYASNLQIYSFYETLETSLGLTSSIIVDKDSAVLGSGFRNEISRYMNANHRGICKFDGPEDPNYQSLKNSLGTAVQALIQEQLVIHGETSKAQLRDLQAFLGVPGPPDDNYERLEGSCQWINDREDFMEWMNLEDGSGPDQDCQYTPSIYWVNANPGAGKTVLTSHVIAQLSEFNMCYAFYHFHAGKKALQSLSGCLRSIAFQMASLNSVIRTTLSGLIEEGAIMDIDDARVIWLRVFKGAILQTTGVTAQYWVLDAIDECIGYPELFTFLKGFRSAFHLNIFITSRKLPDYPKLVRQIESSTVHVVEIPVIDTMRDIDLYIRDRMHVLPIDSQEDKEHIRKQILSKSNASFLWVRLVLDELETVYGYESIMSVLNGIPEGMMSYYRRTINEMRENKRERHIIQAILVWVICASRPLTISELTEALHLDINVRLPSAKTAVEGLCGQLVSIDKQTSTVQIVHTTAREFLLSSEAEDFKISRAEGNERLALICLRLLVSPAMQPPRHRRLLAQKRQDKPGSPLLDYAITQFSEHVLGSSAESDPLLAALGRFLCSTALTWIEKIVTLENANALIRVARNLKAYLDRRAKYRSPLNRHVTTVAGWASDLSRLVTKFGGALVSQPQSIYFLIPPLCPNDTVIHKQFGRSPAGLVLSGFAHKDWDDCAATVSFEDDTAATVTCDDRHIAVGFELGNIQLYNCGSYQKSQTMRHMYPIERLLLDPSGTLIISASIKFLAVWDLNGNMLWQKRLRSRCILLTASSSFVVSVTMSGQAIWWRIATGEQMEDHFYPYQAPPSLDQLATLSTKAPFTAAFSPGMDLLALGYRTGPVCIFELETHEWIGWALDDNSRNITHLIFNPNPDVSLLLIAYDDAHLSLYEPWSGALVHSQRPETDAVLQSLACSPDGRTFATVDAQGNLQIWDFESLATLYHVLTPTNSFRTMVFTSDGFNLVDVVDQEMRIWAPSTLIRKTIEEEGSISDQASVLPVTSGQYERFRSAKLRAAVTNVNKRILVAGNHQGDVMAYNQDGNKTGVLYSHPNSVVKCLALSNNDVVASSDTNGAVQVWRLDTARPASAQATEKLFEVNYKTVIHQLLFDDDGKYLLISTTDSDDVYEVSTSAIVGSLPFPANERMIWKWTYIPASTSTGAFALMCDGKLAAYSIPSFPSLAPYKQFDLELNTEVGFTLAAIDSLVVHAETSSLIIEITQSRGYLTSAILFIFQIPDLVYPTLAASPLKPLRVLLPDYYMHFLAIDQTDRRLVFLHKSSWVCSINLSKVTDKNHARHFFVPNEFTTRARELHPMFTNGRAFVFALHDKFAVIKNGLDFQEMASPQEG